MQYAILGDIHSSKDDLENVLAHISDKAAKATVIGTGDLFECTISKKDIKVQKFTRLKDVMLNPKGFTELLTFPSVEGNQEERILLITDTDDPLREQISSMPEKIELKNAEVIHGHQWKWGGEPWALLQAEVGNLLVFYGHSHHSALSLNGVKQQIDFGTPYSLDGNEVLVNVGAVISDREWVLYDSAENKVTFMKA